MAPSADSAFRTRVEAALERDEPAELADLALAIGQEGMPWEWAQACCARLLRHHNASVRTEALSGFGHLARRFGRLDTGRVRRLIQIALHDPNEAVRRRADDIADDLLTFLGWELERPADRAAD